MAKEIMRFSRMFQLWRYSVSHSQLLLRSKSPDLPTRIDVLFKGVSLIHLPTLFDSLVIFESSEEVGKQSKSQKKFLIESSDFKGHVNALAVFSHEDEGDYFDPSFFDPKSSDRS
jgi:hypothetical protein